MMVSPGDSVPANSDPSITQSAPAAMALGISPKNRTPLPLWLSPPAIPQRVVGITPAMIRVSNRSWSYPYFDRIGTVINQIFGRFASGHVSDQHLAQEVDFMSFTNNPLSMPMSGVDNNGIYTSFYQCCSPLYRIGCNPTAAATRRRP